MQFLPTECFVVVLEGKLCSLRQEIQIQIANDLTERVGVSGEKALEMTLGTSIFHPKSGAERVSDEIRLCLLEPNSIKQLV